MTDELIVEMAEDRHRFHPEVPYGECLAWARRIIEATETTAEKSAVPERVS